MYAYLTTSKQTKTNTNKYSKPIQQAKVYIQTQETTKTYKSKIKDTKKRTSKQTQSETKSITTITTLRNMQNKKSETKHT